MLAHSCTHEVKLYILYGPDFIKKIDLIG